MSARMIKPGQIRLAVYLLLSAAAVCTYLGVAGSQNGEFGFPLDDAWIHQVYARNLAARGEFSFFPGVASAGSTSPLWALTLAGGQAILGDARGWAIALGILFLAGSAFLSSRIAIHLGAQRLVAFWLVPAFTILEWHMTWAAVSGMEVMLFVLISLALVDALIVHAHPLVLGLLAGALTLTRPEGVVLGGLAAVGYLVGVPPSVEIRSRTGSLAVESFQMLAGFMLPVVPYLLFNFLTSGTALPNTFYAKNQEYAVLLTGSYWFERWAALYRQPLLGAQLLFVPGLAWLVWRLVRRRDAARLVPVAWVLALPLLYALRLPVDYQYGRYEMPVIPYVGIFGLVGTSQLLPGLPGRVIGRAWAFSAAALVIIFAWLGAEQYARSVGIVNCEMVGTARWTATNLPPEAVIAAHDIGAQGYFDSHRIIDLAGLVSPEVVPFIRDESRLAAWMKERGADYAVFFPTWYPALAQNDEFVRVRSGDCQVTRESGEANLAVYRILR